MNRQTFPKTLSSTAVLSLTGGAVSKPQAGYGSVSGALTYWPVPDLKKVFPEHIRIQMVELLKARGGYSLSSRLLTGRGAYSLQ